jgi:hypothetical protein
MLSSVRILVVWCTLLFGSFSWGQESTTPKTAAGGAETAVVAAPAATSASAQTGIDQSVIVLPANSDEVMVRVLLRGLDPKPEPSDFEAGLLVSANQPNLQLRLTVTFANPVAVPNKPGDFLAELKIRGLVAFGESHAPLLYKGRQIESLRFSKPGLVAKPAGESGFLAREGSKLPIVLENPSAFEYKSVRARLRFADTDGCAFDAEVFPGATAPGNTATKSADAKARALVKADPKASDPVKVDAQTAGGNQGGATCNTFEKWTAFDVPRYAQVTLRAASASEWFRDPDNRFARAGKKKGWLTLRFQASTDGAIHEQNLPLEVQFEPGNWSLLKSLLCVAGFLALGAALSLLLRVLLPNLKRKRQLKDQLDELAKQTASISTEVDSNLRVLLRVERIALDEIRLAVWPLWPGFADYAQRVEQGLPALKRRIEAVRRLDAALIRRRLLVEQGAAPTRLLQIESQLAAVSESLKQEQLSDEDWVFVNQRLEAAQKTLREPTQTEKEAFDAMLAGRWKAISKHFGFDATTHALKVPDALKDRMKDCFPADKTLLPEENADGSEWIQSVGAVRADLQLSALSLVSEFQFLAPAVITGTEWEKKMDDLNKLLATPAIDNLKEARSLLRQLAERVSEDDIVKALKEGRAMIIIDPAVPRPNQKIRFSVRFREDHLNSAAARDLVRCHWSFCDRHNSLLQGAKRTTAKSLRNLRSILPGQPAAENASQQNDGALPRELNEDGWYVHHYFEGDVTESTTTVSFYDSEGNVVDLGVPAGDAAKKHWSCLSKPVEQSSRYKEEWSRGRLELFQLSAALLVPLATLASTTISGSGSGHWWELIAIGFGADTIKSILVGRQESSTSA